MNLVYRLTSLILIVLTTACSTKIVATGLDSNGRPVPVPIFSTNADIVGEMTLTINSLGQPVWELRAPPVQDYPVMRVAVTNRGKSEILGFNEIPMVPGIYHSRAQTAFFDGMGSMFRNLSNLTGTALSSFFGGLIGLEWVKQGVLTTGATQ